MATPETQKVEGVLSRFVWRSDDTDWVIAIIDTGDGDVTVKGALSGATRGCCYSIEGVQGSDSFGTHLKIRSSLPVIPKTESAIRAFLQTLPNIGSHRANVLVRKWGTAALDKLRTAEFEELKEAGLRLGLAKLHETRLILEGAESDAELKLTVRTMLGDHGTDKLSKKVLDEWGKDSANIIRAHPWRLTDLPRVGFVIADAVARHLGHAPESPERIIAGVLHTMDQIRQGGDTAVHKVFLVQRAAQVLALDGHCADYGGLVLSAIDELRGVLDLIGISDDRVQLRIDRERESFIGRELRERVERKGGWSPATMHKLGLEHLAADQRAALELIVASPTALLVGSPGTGKTYAVKELLRCYRSGAIKLCAPTGKAARRLSEAACHKAQTIHSLLEPAPRKVKGKVVWGFGRNHDFLLEAEVVVVDEVSMIDTFLMSSLLEAMPNECRLVLVGDVAQLPSVGCGCVLRDLMKSKLLPTASLHTIKRTNPGPLLTHIHEVRAGHWTPVVNSKAEGNDLFVMPVPNEELGVAKILELYLDRLPKLLEPKSDPILDIQILLPWKGKKTLSADAVNALVQRRRVELGHVILLKPAFGIGDKVIQVRNDYNLGIVNGDIGFIERISDVELEGRSKAVTCYIVRFQGYPDPVTIPAFSSDLQLAYAITIHKSQGSEWPIVILAALGMSSPFYDRTLFYTALSRAKSFGVIVGNQGGLGRVLSRSTPERRMTNLVETLSGESKAEGASGG